jgi:hypothetical protein
MSRAPIGVPYGSWRAVSQTLDHLEQSGLPARLDNSAFPAKTKQSTIDQVRQSLQQLGLIDDRFKPQPLLDSLLRAHGGKRKEIWVQILNERYKECARIGWERLTAQQLADFLDRRGAENETRQRAARFLRQALACADIEYAETLDQDWINPPRKKLPAEPARKGPSRAANADVGLTINLGRSTVTIGQPPSDPDLDLLQASIRSEQLWRRKTPRAGLTERKAG